jgi:hypothetical protein
MLRQQGNCLHLDGTKKRFTEYSDFQVSTEEGTFSLSHQIMPCGDASSYLKATNDTFFELAESIDPGENQKETAAKLKTLSCLNHSWRNQLALVLRISNLLCI